MSEYTLTKNTYCIKGKNRSLLLQTEQERVEFIPTEIFHIFERDFFLNDLIDCGFNKSDSEEFIFRLLRIGFVKINQPEKADLKIKFNEFLQGDAIIECYDLKLIKLSIAKLKKINIFNITFIFFGPDILPLLDEIKKYKFRYIEILTIGSYIYIPSIDLEKRILNTKSLRKIVCYNQNSNSTIELSEDVNVFLSKTKFENKLCGTINPSSFNLNYQAFDESMKYNSCLFRKITVGRDGNIKNCPSMKESFGNIRDTDLAETIEKPGFKKYWDISKDKIHVCKDCEFRYICTDCRAYVEDPEDILSKPLKCGYNPYTGEWNEWSTNPLKQKAIDFYGMREMVENA